MEGDVVLALEGPAKPPRILEQNQRIPASIVEQQPPAIARDPLDLGNRSRHPSRIAGRDFFEPARRAVLMFQTMEHDVELKHSDGADNWRRSRRLRSGREEHLGRAFFGELAKAGVELLPFHRISRG